jgi:predicted PurR-regulated permease PerM
LLKDADTALSGFVRGQIFVCLCVGILYAMGWGILGLNYGIFLGLFTGIIAFIPYIGQFFGLTLALLVGLGQFGLDPVQLGLIASVFIIVQLIESNFLTPKLVGDQVGLHAVWVIFAIMAGGEIMGFVGVLLALPIAAVIAVVGRWLLKRYLQSAFYHGGDNTAQENRFLVQTDSQNTPDA